MIAADYKRQYKGYINKGGTRSCSSLIKLKGYGKGLDGTGLFVPGSFGVPNIDPKLMEGFVKAVSNHKGYANVL